MLGEGLAAALGSAAEAVTISAAITARRAREASIADVSGTLSSLSAMPGLRRRPSSNAGALRRHLAGAHVCEHIPHRHALLFVDGGPSATR
jgi:hypothetical protein